VLNDQTRDVCRIIVGAIEGRQIVVADARPALADPASLDARLRAAGLASNPATFELHRATLRAAIGQATQ
jgi:hypothetical protein